MRAASPPPISTSLPVGDILHILATFRCSTYETPSRNCSTSDLGYSLIRREEAVQSNLARLRLVHVHTVEEFLDALKWCYVRPTGSHYHPLVPPPMNLSTRQLAATGRPSYIIPQIWVSKWARN